jgi:serine protease
LQRLPGLANAHAHARTHARSEHWQLAPAGGYIPTLGLARAQAEVIKRMLANGNTIATVSIPSSRGLRTGTLSGTSMATPHVSAVAGLVWSAYPGCTNEDVRRALAASALDLGAPGRDAYYGHGLVQVGRV